MKNIFPSLSLSKRAISPLIIYGGKAFVYIGFISLLFAGVFKYIEHSEMVNAEVLDYRYEHRITEKERATLEGLDWLKEGEDLILHITTPTFSFDVPFTSVQWIDRHNPSVMEYADHPHLLYTKTTYPALTKSSVELPLRQRLNFVPLDDEVQVEEVTYSNVFLYMTKDEFLSYVLPLKESYDIHLSPENYLMNEEQLQELRRIQEKTEREKNTKIHTAPRESSNEQTIDSTLDSSPFPKGLTDYRKTDDR